MRLLHPGHGDARGRPAAGQPQADARPRSATAWKATSAAAPATTTSSRPCSGCQSGQDVSAYGRGIGGSDMPNDHGHRRSRSSAARTTASSPARASTPTTSALPGQTYAVFLRSPYAHARDQVASTPTRRQGDAGRAGDLHRRGHRRGQVGGLPCGWLITQQGRHADEGAASTRCWRRARCATSATRWRWWWPRPASRPRTRPS